MRASAECLSGVARDQKLRELLRGVSCDGLDHCCSLRVVGNLLACYPLLAEVGRASQQQRTDVSQEDALVRANLQWRPDLHLSSLQGLLWVW